MASPQHEPGVLVAESIAPQTPRRSAGRPEMIHSFDGLRVLAAFGIVWFHTLSAPGRPLAYAGLPVFLLLSFIVLAMKRDPDPLRPYVVRRAHRLLVPWLFWSAFYLAILVWQTPGPDRTLTRFLTVENVLSGFSPHLWYLPFAFLGSLVLWATLSAARRLPLGVPIGMGITLGALLLVAEPAITERVPEAMPWPQWVYSLACVPLGFALGRSRLLPTNGQRQLAAVVALAVIVPVAVSLLVRGDVFTGTYDDFMGASYAVGIALVCAALIVAVERNETMARLSDLTLGIYLLHPFVGMVIVKAAHRELPFYAEVPVEFIGSALITLGLRRLPFGKQLV